MTNERKIPPTLDVQMLVSLMSDAYGKGLEAGMHAESMRDNAEFVEDAVKLFASGLADSLTGSFGRMAH